MRHPHLGSGPVILAAALLIASCGGVRTYPSAASGSAQQSSSPPASSARLDSPVVPSSSPASGYKAYLSTTSKYSFEYPETWFEYPELQDGPHVGKDFMNQNIGRDRKSVV